MKSFLFKYFWVFTPLLATLMALLMTSIIVIWEWLENPGGIFHNAEGTQWHFVFDTAQSWFLPTWMHCFLIAALIYQFVIRPKINQQNPHSDNRSSTNQ